MEALVTPSAPTIGTRHRYVLDLYVLYLDVVVCAVSSSDGRDYWESREQGAARHFYHNESESGRTVTIISYCTMQDMQIIAVASAMQRGRRAKGRIGHARDDMVELSRVVFSLIVLLYDIGNMTPYMQLSSEGEEVRYSTWDRHCVQQRVLYLR